MGREMILTPEELFLLGKILQAKYIDYAYINMMGDFTKNYQLYEKKNKAELVKKSVLILKDFKGNVEVADWAKELALPIFYGAVESTLDICTIKGDVLKSVKFHYGEWRIAKVELKDGLLNISQVQEEDIHQYVAELIDEQYGETDKHIIDTLQEDSISKMYLVKKIKVGQLSVVNGYLECDDVMYQENAEGKFESLSRKEFETEILSVLKGE